MAIDLIELIIELFDRVIIHSFNIACTFLVKDLYELLEIFLKF